MIDLKNISAQIKEKIGDFKIDVALVLGSGWNDCLNKVQVIAEIDYSAINGMPVCSVKGHNGKFVFATYNGKNVGIMQGRFHMYEGYSAFESTVGLQVLVDLGASVCILTNAAGAVNVNYNVNDIVVLNDCINFTGRNPLVSLKATDEKPVFISMGDCFDKCLIDIATDVCKKSGINHNVGVYAQLLGPSYETSAEIRMLRTMGVDCVGMSTVQEVIMARYLGVRVLGLSYISNMAQGVSDETLNHNDVLENAKKFSVVASNLLLDIIDKI
ncbi:MAG: purine-nucleoside phosphorylase [Christensenellales bacterium]